MDNVIFVNEYNRTKDTMKEIYSYWYFRRPFAIVLIAVILLNLVMRLKDFVLYGYIDPLTTFLVVFIAILYTFTYFMQLNAATKKDEQITHGNQLTLSFSFTPDRIYVGKIEGDYYYDYSQVKFAFETKNYITLVMKSTRMMLTVHKDGFIVGDLDGFRSFINEKKIKIKGKKN